MLQETFIRWHGTKDEVKNPRAFLVTVITRLCLNHLQSARVRREQYVGQWLPEPIVTDDSNDPFSVVRVDESLSMALLVLLERLTPVERAVFILREIFEFEYADIAQALGQSEQNCRQVLHRARQHVGTMKQRFNATKDHHDALLQRFINATRQGDIDALVALLSAHVKLRSDGGGKASAVPNVIEGADKVARALTIGLSHFVPAGVQYYTTSINGEPGVLSFLHGKPFSALVLNVADDRIETVFVVTNPDKLQHLGNRHAGAISRIKSDAG